MKAIFQFLIGAILAISALSSSADPQWYNDVYPTNSNSQISLVNQSGGTVTAIRNPTAASVQLNTNTSTRVPSVLVQASATLPVVTIGTTCDPAKETAALSASDRLTILVCPPTGLWTISNRTRLRTATEGSSCDPVVDGNLAVDSAGVTLSCQSGVWTAPLIGRLSGYNLGRNPWESGTKLLDLGKHKYCALTGKQSMGDSDNHCVIQFDFDYTWTLDSRIITPNQSATWCRAMCID